MWIIFLRFSCQEFCCWKVLKDIRKITFGCCHKILQGCSLLDLLQLVSIYHTGLYCEYTVAFRCGLTADWRLHIARVCGHGSLVKLCGLMQIKFFTHTPLLTGHNTGCGRGKRLAALAWPPKKLSPRRCHRLVVVDLTGRMFSGSSTDQTMCVVVCLKARRTAIQMTVPEIIIASLHCLCVRSVWVSKVPVLRCAFVLHIVWSLVATIS